jgi:hypothetical protein
MVLKNYLFSFFVLCCFSLFSLQSYSQFIQPVQTEKFVQGPGNVPAAGAPDNTGNDTRDFDGERNMRVMCWDGDQPSFAWDNAKGNKGQRDIEGTISGTVTDPDIVLGKDGRRAMIVYLIDNVVHYEVWEWNGVDFVVDIPHTQISQTPTANVCNNPNVDVTRTGEVVAVWERDDEIKTRAGDMTNGFGAYPITTLSGCNFDKGTRSTPDVSIYEHDNASASTSVVSYVFKIDESSNNNIDLVVHQELLVDIQNGSLNFLDCQLLYDGQTFPMSAPRIAANHFDGTGVNNDDFTVVVQRDDLAGHNFIEGFVRKNSSNKFSAGNPTVILNSANAPDLSHCINDNPVVSYVGDYIITSWMNLQNDPH